MRLEALGARTWSLMVAAGWALLVWLMAVMGLGGRVAEHGDANGRVPDLPRLSLPLTEATPPLDRYAGIAEHSVFSEDRRPKPFQLEPEPQLTATGEIRLTGVLITPTLQVATLQAANGTALRLRLNGPEAGGWRLLSLQPRQALVAGPGGDRSMELQTYGGTRGAQAKAPRMPPSAAQPATPIAQAAAIEEAQPMPLVPAATTQDEIDVIRKRIEDHQLQQQQGRGDAPAAKDPT